VRLVIKPQEGGPEVGFVMGHKRSLPPAPVGFFSQKVRQPCCTSSGSSIRALRKPTGTRGAENRASISSNRPFDRLPSGPLSIQRQPPSFPTDAARYRRRIYTPESTIRSPPIKP